MNVPGMNSQRDLEGLSALVTGATSRGSGSIISLGSMAGQIGLAGGAAYGATKATLAAMTRSWAAEFSPPAARTVDPDL